MVTCGRELPDEGGLYGFRIGAVINDGRRRSSVGLSLRTTAGFHKSRVCGYPGQGKLLMVHFSQCGMLLSHLIRRLLHV